MFRVRRFLMKTFGFIEDLTFSHIFSSTVSTRLIEGGPFFPLSTGVLLSHRDTTVFSPTVLRDPPIVVYDYAEKLVCIVFSLVVPTILACFVLFFLNMRQSDESRVAFTKVSHTFCHVLHK